MATTDSLALMQEAIKSNDNFALIRRWRWATGTESRL